MEDRNHSGFLDVSELKSAIQTAGMSIGAEQLPFFSLW